MKKTVILIYGGEGYEHEISKESAKAIYSAIDKSLFDVIPVFISREGNWFITDGIGKSILRPTYPARIDSRSGLLSGADLLPADVAIPALHGDYGEDGIIQGALDCAHIPYIGCRVFASAVCIDKVYTKIIAEHFGIPSAKYTVVYENDEPEAAILRAEGSLSYPMFLKPARLGSSVGAARANNRAELSSALREARLLSGKILIEECIDVLCELECGFFEEGGKIHISPSGRIHTGGIFYDYEGKYGDRNAPKISHGSADYPELSKKAASYAKILARAIGLSGLSRIDFFITRQGELLFNEINTFPGMTKSSLYPLLTEDMGFAKNEYINILLSEAVR